MNYYGVATINFPIYRKDKDGIIYEFSLEIEGTSFFQHGYDYPDESGTHINFISCDDHSNIQLTDEEENEALLYIEQEVKNNL